MDLSLIGRQLRREIEQGEEARRRLESQTRTAHERAYGSSTVYGQKLLKTKLGLVASTQNAQRLMVGRRRLRTSTNTRLPILRSLPPHHESGLDVLGQEQRNSFDPTGHRSAVEVSPGSASTRRRMKTSLSGEQRFTVPLVPASDGLPLASIRLVLSGKPGPTASRRSVLVWTASWHHRLDEQTVGPSPPQPVRTPAISGIRDAIMEMAPPGPACGPCSARPMTG